jgi:drug/metabolite transporter (DMT)-like permease
MELPSSTLKGIGLTSITMFMWGFLAIVLKVISRDLSPISIVWFRFLLAFMILFFYYFFSVRKKISILGKPPLMLIFAALFLGFNYLGFNVGIHMTTPGNAQIFTQLGPVLLALAGIFIYREEISSLQIIGFLLIIVGLILFYFQQITFFTDKILQYNKGIVWVIFGAIYWALYAILQKEMVQDFPPQQLNMVIYGFPAIFFFPFADFKAISTLGWIDWILLIFSGINTLIAYGTLSAAFKYIEANKISVIITLNPIITFITLEILKQFNVSWIKPENLNLISASGASLVLIGAVLVVRK